MSGALGGLALFQQNQAPSNKTQQNTDAPSRLGPTQVRIATENEKKTPQNRHVTETTEQ